MSIKYGYKVNHFFQFVFVFLSEMLLFVNGTNMNAVFHQFR